MKPIWLLTMIWMVPAGFVAGKVRHVQGLGHDALAGESGVAVNGDRQRGLEIEFRLSAMAALLLRGARVALDDGVDELQVARVGHERDRHLADAALFVGAAETKMVLDVARIAPSRRRTRFVPALRRFESDEDIGVGFAQHMREDVQAAPVRHAHDNVARAVLRREPNDLVQDRHQHVGAFDGEPFAAFEGGVDEAFKRFDFGEAFEEILFLFGGKSGKKGAALGGVAQPVALFAVFDMFVVVANGSE